MKTENIRRRHIAHDTYLRQAITILQQRKDAELPVSFDVFSGIAKSIESIFSAILNCADDSNIYACSVLYRSLIEHFHKGFILVNELVINRSDESSVHYQQHLFLAEFIAEQMGCLESDDIIAGNMIKTNVLKYIADKFPGLDIEKENQQEVSIATKKFSFKEIVKKLHAEFSEKSSTKPVADFFTKMLPEYSRFSTFTHGGPHAQLITKNLEAKGLEEELDRLAEISLTALCIIKEHLLMCFKLERDEAFSLLSMLHKLRAESNSK